MATKRFRPIGPKEDPIYVANADDEAKRFLGLKVATKPIFVLTAGPRNDHYDYSGLDSSRKLLTLLERDGTLVQSDAEIKLRNGNTGFFDKYRMQIATSIGPVEIEFLVYRTESGEPMVFYKGYGNNVRSMVSSVGNRLRRTL